MKLAGKIKEVEAFKQAEVQASNVAHQSRLHRGQEPSGGTIIQLQWTSRSKKRCSRRVKKRLAVLTTQCPSGNVLIKCDTLNALAASITEGLQLCWEAADTGGESGRRFSAFAFT